MSLGDGMQILALAARSLTDAATRNAAADARAHV
jgi:hypothetical protein